MNDDGDNMQLSVAMGMFAQCVICSFILKFSLQSSVQFYFQGTIDIKISSLYAVMKKQCNFNAVFKI